MFTNRPAIKTSNGSLRGARRTNLDDPEVTYGSISEDVYHIRNMVQRQLLAETEGEVNLREEPQMRRMIETFFNQVISDDNLLFSKAERERMLEWVFSDILGYGPLEPLLQDESVTEVGI
jgi:pilus assembly protein CpaF